MGVGILGIAAVLPPTVRTNDYWSQELIESWSAKLRFDESPSDEPRFETEGQQIMFDAMKDAVGDPFHGVRERRIAAPGTRPSDLEVSAGKNALDDASIEPKDVDVLLVASAVSDFLVLPNAPKVHHELGLSSHVMSMNTDAAANSFLQQLSLASSLISAGQAEVILLIQSCLMSRLADNSDASGSWWGDAATAVVVARVPEADSILAVRHHTDGSFFDVSRADSKDGDWFDGGEVRWRVANLVQAKRMMLSVADIARAVVSPALQDVGIDAKDVDFFGGYQGASWLQNACRLATGHCNAKTVDIFPTTGMLGPAQVPMTLQIARESGVLEVGSLCTLFSGGSGITASGAVLRWIVE
ncbi:MAG: 3-oxoacyl-[acyl-carrier-protein] synthase III C-terminal domain-containing protein [Myxococcota bacterium]